MFQENYAAGWLFRMHPLITQSSFDFGDIIESITSQNAFSAAVKLREINFYRRIPHFVRSSHSPPISKTCSWPPTSPLPRSARANTIWPHFTAQEPFCSTSAQDRQIMKAGLYWDWRHWPLHSGPRDEKLANQPTPTTVGRGEAEAYCCPGPQLNWPSLSLNGAQLAY